MKNSISRPLYTVGPAGDRDIYAVPVGVDRAAVPLVAGDLEESSPALSPDGRWLAYVAGNPSIEYNVYVRPFPNTDDGLWRVSTTSADGPVWANSGRELFYTRTGKDLVSVEILPGPNFAMGERRVLFSAREFRLHGPPQYDVTPDDQRFVMIRSLGRSEADQLIVVENFFEELKAKVGNE